MRWLTLYARSRRLPAALAALAAGAAAVWWLARFGDGGTAGPRTSALVLAGGVMVLSPGLGGPDPALDRTAAIRWPLHRTAHVLLCALLAGSVLLALRAADGQPPDPGFVLRDAAGLAGLAALGAACLGPPYAWLPPFGCLAAALTVPPGPDPVIRILTWPVLPPGTAPAGWTALALAVTGTAAYALAGPRR
ncbi:hypothetical protein ACFCX4_13385 [Kitasatospora sp. NPDC056327]|uniref:hypothetical protein n=1 Tax=Kitasatospora sp. NPDC056327 TaxID=3345785 RepID=UPI0035E049AE